MEKTRFKLNICGVDVTVSGDVDRDGAEAIAERVRVRMEEVLNNAYGATIEKAAVIAAMNLSEELSRTEAALNQAREEADALRTKTKEFAGADGLKARLSEAEMKLGVLRKSCALPKTAPKLRKRKRKKRKPLPKTQRTRQLQNRSTCRHRPAQPHAARLRRRNGACELFRKGRRKGDRA